MRRPQPAAPQVRAAPLRPNIGPLRRLVGDRPRFFVARRPSTGAAARVGRAGSVVGATGSSANNALFRSNASSSSSSTLTGPVETSSGSSMTRSNSAVGATRFAAGLGACGATSSTISGSAANAVSFGSGFNRHIDDDLLVFFTGSLDRRRWRRWQRPAPAFTTGDAGRSARSLPRRIPAASGCVRRR